MCYDIKANLKSLLKKAKYFNDDPALIGILEEKIRHQEVIEFHHVSGFQHPQLPIITNDEDRVHLATWGLIPFWTKDLVSGMKFYNKTLNARSETIFEKPSFRSSAKSKRCLIAIDGFYEHHHSQGKTYPFYIHKKNSEPLVLAGLWSNWRSKDGTTNMDSFTIVTTQGNPLLSRIHNNPKLKGPRMPVILLDELADTWLSTEVESEHDKSELILTCCQPYDDSELAAYTVAGLRGKNDVGNKVEAHQEKLYEELEDYDAIKVA